MQYKRAHYKLFAELRSLLLMYAPLKSDELQFVDDFHRSSVSFVKSSFPHISDKLKFIGHNRHSYDLSWPISRGSDTGCFPA